MILLLLLLGMAQSILRIELELVVQPSTQLFNNLLEHQAKLHSHSHYYHYNHHHNRYHKIAIRKVKQPILQLSPLAQSEAVGTILTNHKSSHHHHHFHQSHPRTVPLKNIRNRIYVGELRIGSQPNNQFHMIFDTGSSYMFVSSTKCRSHTCKLVNQYDAAASSTHQPMMQPIEINYGSGSIRGMYNKDDVQLASIVVPQFEFIEVVLQAGDGFSDGAFEGLVGLCNPERGSNLFQSMKLEKPVFSFYMGRVGGYSGHSILFGGIDESLKWTWHQSIGNYFWMLGVEKILIDSNDTRLCSPHAKCKFIVDTGTTIITGPSKSVSKLLQMIPLAQQCKNFYQLPSIGFQVDGVVYTLDVTDYAATIAQSQPPDLYVHHPIEEVIGCVSAIMPLDMYERDSPWILGNVFLTKYAVAFDERLRRIGLANNLLL